MQIDLNDKTIRSYKTKEALIAGINRFGLNGELDKYVIVCTEQGRYTAIFSSDRFRIEGGYVMLYAQYGFMTM